MTRPTRTITLTVSAGLALTLSACGSNDKSAISPGAGASASSSATGTIDAAHNDVDVTFIKDMSPHHTGAIGMAELVADRSDNAKVKDLGARILSEQQPELTRMAAMSKAWGATLDSSGGHSMGSGSSMSGGHSMGGTDDVDALTPLKGVAFDKEFLTRMLAHHMEALPMSQAELDGGQNPQGKQLAQAIIDAQTKEIDEMKALQTELA